MSSLSLGMSKKKYIVHPYKFNLWLFILATTMIFGGLTSAYIVARSFLPAAQRLYFELPAILWNNLAVLLFSSVTIQFAVWSNSKGEAQRAMLGLLMTLVLGLVFLFGQVKAWEVMFQGGLPLVDPARIDNSVSFFYIFTGLHGAHILFTLFILIYALIKISLNSFKQGPEGRRITLEMTATFWHYLGLLWVYLFVFLLYTQQV